MTASEQNHEKASRDLAAFYAEELRQQHEASIENPEEFLDEKDDLEFNARKSIFKKIQYKWHNSDQMILAQIEAGAARQFEADFLDAIIVIDDFYKCLRVPTGRNGPDGRPIWATDTETGKPIEDWSQLTGQDIEMTLLKLQSIKFKVAPRVNKLLLQAVYAKYVFTDTHDDSYYNQMDGTQLDKTAKANQVARSDKYQAYFRYYLFRSADTFMKEIDNFMRMLEKMRDWGIWSQKG